MFYSNPHNFINSNHFTSPPTPTAASFPFPPGFNKSSSSSHHSSHHCMTEHQSGKTPTLASEALIRRHNRHHSMDAFEFDSGSDNGSTASEAELATPNSISQSYLSNHRFFEGDPALNSNVKPYSTGAEIEATARKLQESLSFSDGPRDVRVVTEQQATLFPTFGDVLRQATRSTGHTMNLEDPRAKLHPPNSIRHTLDPADRSSLGLGLGMDVPPSSELEYFKERESQNKFTFRPFDSPMSDSFTFHPAFLGSPDLAGAPHHHHHHQSSQHRTSNSQTWLHAPAPVDPREAVVSSISHRLSSEGVHGLNLAGGRRLSAAPTPPHTDGASRLPGPPPSHPLPPLPYPPTPPGSRVKKGPATLPPVFVPASKRPPTPPSTSVYPLTAGETELVATLHNGRVPEMNQLAPTMGDVASLAGAAPIVNTGNHGPMVVQQGDWECGACNFVNWRRRKICMRCFPFANDIGNVLTIKSHAASMLASPPHLTGRDKSTPSPTHSANSNSSRGHRHTQSHSAHQHQTQAHYQHPSINAYGDYQPLASTQMSRSYTFPPNATTSNVQPSLSRASFGPTYFYPAPVPHTRMSQTARIPAYAQDQNQDVWNPPPRTSSISGNGGGSRTHHQAQRNLVIYPALAV